jgi:hypothetical protein
MADGYTLSFLFSGAEHSLLEQIKLITLGLWDLRRKFYAWCYFNMREYDVGQDEM